MSNKYIIFSATIIAVIIIGIFVIKGDKIKDYLLSPFTTIQPSVSPFPSVSPTPSLTPGTSPVNNITPKCWLTGEIVFDGEVFKHIGAQEFNYKDVDDPHDIIKWQISPSEETFSIGPNRFSGLNLPKGSDYLTISFDGSTPKYNQYDLTASVDYVVVINNAAKILNEKCSGKTTLIINK